MSAVDPIFFITDQCDIGVSATTFSASTTALGYSVDNAREKDLAKAWLPTDGTSDEWIKADMGSTSVLGAAGATFYACIAYDARGSTQTNMHLQYDTADNPAFTSPSVLMSFAGVDPSGVTCDYQSAVMPTPAKRYFRLIQANSYRGGGTKCAKIYNFGMFKADGVIRVGVDYTQDTAGRFDMDNLYRMALAKTASDLTLTNRYSAPGQRFHVAYEHASDSMFVALRNLLSPLTGVGVRALYSLFDGIRNSPAALDNFFMMQLVDDAWRSGRDYKGVMSMGFTMETVPWI